MLIQNRLWFISLRVLLAYTPNDDNTFFMIKHLLPLLSYDKSITTEAPFEKKDDYMLAGASGAYVEMFEGRCGPPPALSSGSSLV